MATVKSSEPTASSSSWDLEDHVRGTIYGQCAGDAIGLLTEFMCKEQATKTYEEHPQLEFEHKIDDMHRCRWKTGDWTDDSDQMIVLMDMLVDLNGTIDPVECGKRIKHWAQRGFKELGDYAGMGIGSLTHKVLSHEKYGTDPVFAAEDVWKKTGCVVASNGSVMRTSVLGIHQYKSLDTVVENAKLVSLVTHADPRCVASCVAVVAAISFMLQRQPQHVLENGDYNIDILARDSYKLAKLCLKGKNYRKYKNEMKRYMFAKKISALDLEQKDSIGYAYKALGAGFWALRQSDFRAALQEMLLEGGDADTNGAVAGALLGCKLGASKLPPTWRDKLMHKEWLDAKIARFLEFEKISPGEEPKSKVESTTTENGQQD